MGMHTVEDLLPHLPHLPVFPLPNVVFFPHTLLPLHVFEPRYRQLVQDARSDGLPIAVPRIHPSGERDEHERPVLCPVAGVGFIRQSQALPDGRFFIELAGLTRVSLVTEHEPNKMYRLVQAELLADQGYDLNEATAQLHTLRLIVQAMHQSQPEGARVLSELIAQETDPGLIADRVAPVLLSDPDQRQRLLEMPQPLHRLSAVIDRLSELMASESGRSDRSLN